MNEKQQKQDNVIALAAQFGAIWGGVMNTLLNRTQLDTRAQVQEWRNLGAGAGYAPSTERTSFLAAADDLLGWFPVED